MKSDFPPPDNDPPQARRLLSILGASVDILGALLSPLPLALPGGILLAALGSFLSGSQNLIWIILPFAIGYMAGAVLQAAIVGSLSAAAEKLWSHPSRKKPVKRSSPDDWFENIHRNLPSRRDLRDRRGP